MDRLTTFTRKALVFKIEIIFFSIRCIRLSTVDSQKPLSLSLPSLSLPHSPMVCRSPLHCCLIISSSLVSSFIISLTVEWTSISWSLAILSSSVLERVCRDDKSASATFTASTGVHWGRGGGWERERRQILFRAKRGLYSGLGVT